MNSEFIKKKIAIIKTYFNATKKDLPFSAFSFALAILLTLFLYKQIQSNQNSESSASDKTAEVLIARQPVAAGETLHSEHIEVTSIVRKHIPLGVILASESQSILGNTSRRSIAAGEMMLWSSFELKTNASSFSHQIGKNMRLVSVPANSLSSMGFRISKGDLIDILHSHVHPPNHAPQSYVLLQNIKVAGTGNRGEYSQSGYDNLHLMVKPEEAVLIQQALLQGSLNFALRNPDDRTRPQSLKVVSEKDFLHYAHRNLSRAGKETEIEIIQGQNPQE